MSDIRDISIKIRKKYPPDILHAQILCDIVHILFEYQDDQEAIGEKQNASTTEIALQNTKGDEKIVG